MKFFNMEWYISMQDENTSVIDINQPFVAYSEHLRDIQGSLLAGVQQLSMLTFHDCLVDRFELVDQRLTITLKGLKSRRDGSESVSGTHVLTFDDVTHSDLETSHLGAVWGYEEIHLIDGHFRICVMLPNIKKSFQVDFSTVQIETDPG